jgi:hypothetical protein
MSAAVKQSRRTKSVSFGALVASSIGLVALVMSCGDDFNDGCSPWCTVVEGCTETSFSDCMAACAEESSQARAISSECASVVRDQNLCLGELDCQGFEAWLSETPPESYPCRDADDAVGMTCF